MSYVQNDDGIWYDEPEPVFVGRTEVRDPYNYDPDEVSMLTGLPSIGESLAQQNMRDETDINTIVRRFGLTGQLPDSIKQPQYTDYLGITDYHSAMNAVRAAGEAFMELPAHIRSEFQNDPQKYLEFFADDANRARAEELGLVPKKVVEAVQAVMPPAPAPEPSKAP